MKKKKQVYNPAQLDNFVSKMVEEFNSSKSQLLCSWEKKIHICVKDSEDWHFYLVSSDGKFSLISENGYNSMKKHEITIECDLETFEQIFVTKEMKPGNAYLKGKISLKCSPRDLLQINRTFNAFIDSFETVGGGEN